MLRKGGKQILQNITGKRLMKGDCISSFFLVLFAFWVCYLSKRLSLWNSQGPSDGFFPFLGGVALGVLGIWQFVRSLLEQRQDNEVKAAAIKIKLFTYIASLLAYALLFEFLGFLLATFFFLIAICKGAEKASWKGSLLISSLSTGICFLLFNYLLDVPFPFGFLKAFFQ
jgi:hypothetical protein